MTKVVRVAVADDHPMFRYGLCAVLAAAPELEVVGEAADGNELVALVERTQPDVVITDLTMPGRDGASATRQILELHPEVGVLVLTMHTEDEALFDALLAGARGYLLKGAEREEITRAVLAVASGQVVYGSAVGRRVVDVLTGDAPARAENVFPGLTAREREVLDLVARGLGNHEIARRLVLSEKTVRNHLAAVLNKLELHDRSAAVAKARDAGLGAPS